MSYNAKIGLIGLAFTFGLIALAIGTYAASPTCKADEVLARSYWGNNPICVKGHG